MRKLSLGVSERARLRILELLRSHDEGSLPALFFGSETLYRDNNGQLREDVPPHWSLNVYPKLQAEQLARDYTSSGHTLMHRVGDITLCVPQTHLIAELEGKTLDVEGRTVSVPAQCENDKLRCRQLIPEMVENEEGFGQ